MKAIVKFIETTQQRSWRCDHCDALFAKIKKSEHNAMTDVERQVFATAMLQTAEEHVCGT